MKIKIVSPSGAIDPQYIDRATEVLRGWGYEVSEAAHARGKVGRFAASDKERVADIAEALTDPAVDMILCARGGYGLQRIIDRIPPIHKPIIGFSDITALHMLAAQTGQATIHAMMCKGISETKGLSPSSCVLHPSSFLQRALAQEPLHYELPAHPLNRAGKTKGTLIGGNLSVLYGLQGTEYGLDERLRIKEIRLNSSVDEGARINDERLNSADSETSETKVISPSSCVLHPSSSAILFIEDVGERHYHIDRMMNNLRLSGVLAKISGLIVGQFNDCEDDPSMGCTVYETIRRAVEPYHYPVVFNFPAGHVEENMPLYLNAPVEMDVQEDYSSSIHSFFKSS
ncbi:MAG: LD-carboxypeptidase [Paludibacteraceae bacterium]|nr:LD-carboxypeptidase [Paludibacteraceae bacterium]